MQILTGNRAFCFLHFQLFISSKLFCILSSVLRILFDPILSDLSLSLSFFFLSLYLSLFLCFSFSFFLFFFLSSFLSVYSHSLSLSLPLSLFSFFFVSFFIAIYIYVLSLSFFSLTFLHLFSYIKMFLFFVLLQIFSCFSYSESCLDRNFYVGDILLHISKVSSNNTVKRERNKQ